MEHTIYLYDGHVLQHEFRKGRLAKENCIVFQCDARKIERVVHVPPTSNAFGFM
jgi:hypothetical protein